METREIIGLLTAFVVLAGITYAIANGDKTASVIQASTGGFASMLNAATGRML